MRFQPVHQPGVLFRFIAMRQFVHHPISAQGLRPDRCRTEDGAGVRARPSELLRRHRVGYRGEGVMSERKGMVIRIRIQRSPGGASALRLRVESALANVAQLQAARFARQSDA